MNLAHRLRMAGFTVVEVSYNQSMHLEVRCSEAENWWTTLVIWYGSEHVVSFDNAETLAAKDAEERCVSIVSAEEKKFKLRKERQAECEAIAAHYESRQREETKGLPDYDWMYATIIPGGPHEGCYGIELLDGNPFERLTLSQLKEFYALIDKFNNTKNENTN